MYSNPEAEKLRKAACSPRFASKKMAGVLGLVILVYFLSLGPLARWSSDDTKMFRFYIRPAQFTGRIPIARELLQSYIEFWIAEGDLPQTTP